MTDAVAAPPAAAAGAGRSGPGARLKAAREQRGLSVGEVAESLHVAPRLIGALEANDFAAFDAPVYAKGFLRKYATFVGVSPDEALAAYQAAVGESAPPAPVPALNVAPASPALGAVPLGPLAAVVALTVVGSLAWWWSARPAAPKAPAAPITESAPAAAEPVAEARPARSAPAPFDEPPAYVPRPPEPRSRPVATLPVIPATAAVATPAVATASSARHSVGGRGDDSLVIHGLRDCWVEVYSPSGGRLVYDLVRTGETRSAPGPGPWKVFLGTADGARLTVGERGVTVPATRRGATTARFVVAGDGATQ